MVAREGPWYHYTNGGSGSQLPRGQLLSCWTSSVAPVHLWGSCGLLQRLVFERELSKRRGVRIVRVSEVPRLKTYRAQNFKRQEETRGVRCTCSQELPILRDFLPCCSVLEIQVTYGLNSTRKRCICGGHISSTFGEWQLTGVSTVPPAVIFRLKQSPLGMV